MRVRLRSPWLLVGLVLLVFAQAVNPARTWQYLLVGVFVLNAVAAYWARELATKVRAQRRLLWSWAQVGDMLEEQFELHNDSWLPVLWSQVVDYSTIPGYDVARVESAPGRASRVWRTRSLCRRRGSFRLGPWELCMSDPVGIFEVRHFFEESREVIVFPPIVRVPQLALPRGEAAGVLRSRARARTITVDVGGVRQYVPGDSLSHIHWRTTARTQALYVKEFERQPAGTLWVLLDLDERVQAGVEPETTAEYAVTIGASLAYAALREGRPVGLYCDGAFHVHLSPNVGLGHLWELMRILTRVEPGKGPSLGELLESWSRVARRDSTVAVITPSGEADWLPPLLRALTRGVAASITLLDRASFGGDGQSEMSQLLSALTELGVPCRVVRAGMEFEHLVPLAYRGLPRFKVGATGRAYLVREPKEVRQGEPWLLPPLR